MGKRIQYTKITPLPSNVPRQLAIELLHSHEEVIALNPLVTGSKKIEAPRDAPNDEYFSTWYEIAEIITWGFGMKKKINFKGVFHDLPYGMQSHIYAPMGVDLRNKYRIGGNQPGEPRETRELGVDTPLDGLYLREDVEIVCNLALASFVKKETKEATGKMIERLARKAELLDEGKLHAMFSEGKLKTSKPTYSDVSEGSVIGGGSVHGGPSPPLSPTLSTTSGLASPRLDKRGFGNYHDVARSASQHRSNQYVQPYQQQGYSGSGYAQAGSSMTAINELPGDMYQQPQNVPDPLKPQGGMSFRSELPGDTSFSTTTTSAGTPSPQPSPRHPSQELHPSPRHPSQELKHPTQQYQAYPPAQQHPTQRNSYYSEHSSTIPTPELQQRQPTFNGPNWPLSTNSDSSQHLNPNTARYSAEQAQPPSSIMPDHQRFSQMSVQSGAGAPANVKCPVCSLFEGDEAAVSHHVSKAHFS